MRGKMGRERITMAILRGKGKGFAIFSIFSSYQRKYQLPFAVSKENIRTATRSDTQALASPTLLHTSPYPKIRFLK
jgi:hypothetical protein